MVYKDDCKSYIYDSNTQLCTLLKDNFYYFLYECTSYGAGHDTIHNCLEDDSKYPDNCKKMVESECLYHGNILLEEHYVSEPEDCFQMSENIHGEYYVYDGDSDTCTVYDSNSRTCTVQRGVKDVQPSDCPN